jgi:hypothetical protein
VERRLRAGDDAREIRVLLRISGAARVLVYPALFPEGGFVARALLPLQFFPTFFGARACFQVASFG